MTINDVNKTTRYEAKAYEAKAKAYEAKAKAKAFGSVQKFWT